MLENYQMLLPKDAKRRGFTNLVRNEDTKFVEIQLFYIKYLPDLFVSCFVVEQIHKICNILNYSNR